MYLQLVLIVVFICFNLISSTSSLENGCFSKLNANPIYYNKIHSNFTTRSHISCVNKCITLNFIKRCTHVVIKHIDNGKAQCIILDATNGSTELQIVDTMYAIWINGNVRPRLRCIWVYILDFCIFWEDFS